MMIYVSHSFNGSDQQYQAVRDRVLELQEDDWDNCYVCPVLSFPFAAEVDSNKMLAIRLDLMSVCDCLFVASDPDNTVAAEIEFAKTVGMEICYV